MLDRAIRLLANASTHEMLPEICADVGLSRGPEVPDVSLRERVHRKFQILESDRVPHVIAAVGEKYHDLELEEDALSVVERDQRPITEITRRDIARSLGTIEMQGALGLLEFLERIWPRLEWMTGPDPLGNLVITGIRQHMIKNQDWSVEELFVQLGALHCSRKRFGALLELTVSPFVRRGNEQVEIVEWLNAILNADGYRLEIVEHISGHPVYRLHPIATGVAGRPKNLIFASNGLKPLIGFSDAINNDIVVLEHETSCLIYDRPIPPDGLLWRDLTDWYAAVTGFTDRDDAFCRKALGERLLSSMASEVEKAVFEGYFRAFAAPLGKVLPALIPQVYLHYDPATVSKLRSRTSFPRQRMDFLLLLPHRARIIIEVDGKQHYSTDDGKASPDRYAEMVSADRDLRLLGYEVYRFGGKELVGDGAADAIARFFERLFEKHGISGG